MIDSDGRRTPRLQNETANRRMRAVRLAVLLRLAVMAPGLEAQSGALDTSFDPGTGVDQLIYSIAVQDDGKILVGGDFTSFDGTPRTNIARLNVDGSLDTSFDPGPGVGGPFPYVNAVAVLPDRKVILGGSFASVGGSPRSNLARLNSTGGLDGTFMAQTDDTVNAVMVETNGSVVLGGFFTQVNGTPRMGVARLDASGVLHPGLNLIVTGGFSAIFALALQNDGKIIIGGSFTNISGSARTNVARLNADGSLDSNFLASSVGGGQLSPAVITAVAVDGADRVLLGGDFTSVNGADRTNLARLNSDGTLDGRFNPTAGTDFGVNSIIVQNDGKVLVGGFFNEVNGSTYNHIARLNRDGTLDGSFDPGAGASDVIYSLALQADGNVLLGGGFTDFGGTPRNGIARLQNILTIPAPEVFAPELRNQVFTASTLTLRGRTYVLEYINALAETNWTSILPETAGDGTAKTFTDQTATVSQRFYRMRAD